MTKKDLLRFFSRNAFSLVGVVIVATTVLVVHQVLFARGPDGQKPEGKKGNQQQTASAHAAASGEQEDRQKNDDHRGEQSDKGNSNPKGHDDKHAKDSEEKRGGHKPRVPDSDDDSSSAATAYCPPDPVDGWKGFMTRNNECSEQKIVSITGLKQIYVPKEPIQLTIDGILTDGSAATPDGGWNVQYYTYSVTDPVNYLQEYIDSGNFNATFPDGH